MHFFRENGNGDANLSKGEKVQAFFVVTLEVLKFFAKHGWDFMDQYSTWLANLNAMFWGNLDFDECYDDNDKYYLLSTLEYILARWDPDIQVLSDRFNSLNMERYGKDSKQHKVSYFYYFYYYIINNMISMSLRLSTILDSCSQSKRRGKCC